MDSNSTKCQIFNSNLFEACFLYPASKFFLEKKTNPLPITRSMIIVPIRAYIGNGILHRITAFVQFQRRKVSCVHSFCRNLGSGAKIS